MKNYTNRVLIQRRHTSKCCIFYIAITINHFQSILTNVHRKPQLEHPNLNISFKNKIQTPINIDPDNTNMLVDKQNDVLVNRFIFSILATEQRKKYENKLEEKNV